MSFIRKILEISSDSIGITQYSSDLPDVLKEFYSYKNGCFLFEESLIFVPYDIGKKINIFYLNDVMKNLIEENECIFFAFNKLGDLFFVKEECFYMYNVEIGEVEKLANDFEEFSRKIISNYNYYSGYSLVVEWQHKNRKMAIDEILIPKIPFVLGGEYNIDNLRVIDFEKGLCEKNNLRIKLNDFEDGTAIMFYT